MVLTPNPAQSPTQFSGPLVQNPAVENPAVLNLRRPGTVLGEAVSASIATADANIVLATVVEDDSALPPTVLRLPHLAATFAHGSSRKYSIASIAHWVAIVLGAIVALWLIFAGRAKPLEDLDKPGATAPARADAAPGVDWKAPPLPSAGDSAAPSWNPPPLPSAGDSSAPKWTPPAAATPSAPTTTPAAPTAHEHDHEQAPEGEMPAHESWPKAETSEPAASQPDFPAAPETTAQYAPIGTGASPAYRTAQREAPLDEQPAPATDDDAQPLGITVPVPQ